MNRSYFPHIQGSLAFMVQSSLKLLVVLYLVASGLSPLIIGTTISLMSLTTLVSAIPLGLLGDRYGRRLSMGLGLSLVSLSLLLMLTLDLLMISIALVIFGLGWAAYEPSVDALIGDVTPIEKVGRTFGLLATVFNVGITIGPVLGGLLFDLVGFSQALMINFVIGMGCVALTSVLPKGSKKREIRSFRLSRNEIGGQIVAGWIGCILGFTFLGSMDTFFPVYARSLGITSAMIGLILSGKPIISALSRVPLGLMADKEGLRIKILVVGLLLSSFSWAITVSNSEIWVLVILVITAGLGVAMFNTGSVTMIAAGAPQEKRGFAFGVATTSRQLGLTFGPLLTGFLVSGTGFWFGIFGMNLIVSVGTVMLFSMFIRESKPRLIRSS